MNQLFILMAPQQGQGQGNGAMNFIMMGAIIVVFYLFMIRPQMKKAKEQKKYIESLKKGDKVLILGGIYAKIVEVKEDSTFIVEVEDGTKMKIARNAVTGDPSSTPTQQ